MDEQQQPFISVIIPVFNDAERLKHCLAALDQQTYPGDRYEIIVVDNGSTENIKSVVEQFPRATFALETRTGSYAARNKGISLAQGPVIAFTDADCVPAQTWLATGVSHLLKTPNCGLVAGRIELFFQNPDRPTTVEMYESVTAFQQRKFVEDLHYGATANVFTYKHVLEKAGLFNDTLKSNGDREWGQRVYAAGFKQVYADDLCVSHPARYTWGQLYKRIIRITGGHHDFKRQKGYTWKGFLRDLSRDLLPPLDNYSCIWSAQRLNPLQKVQMTLVMLSTKYLSAWERVRLQFGGISTRG
jgi:glycosyltransferase involved in cell wall biosynthesis